jgi:hypothetical protein
MQRRKWKSRILAANWTIPEMIDHPEAWPETSSTAMFTFAMITG